MEADWLPWYHATNCHALTLSVNASRSLVTKRRIVPRWTRPDEVPVATDVSKQLVAFGWKCGGGRNWRIEPLSQYWRGPSNRVETPATSQRVNGGLQLVSLTVQNFKKTPYERWLTTPKRVESNIVVAVKSAAEVLAAHRRKHTPRVSRATAKSVRETDGVNFYFGSCTCEIKKVHRFGTFFGISRRWKAIALRELVTVAKWNTRDHATEICRRQFVLGGWLHSNKSVRLPCGRSGFKS